MSTVPARTAYFSTLPRRQARWRLWPGALMLVLALALGLAACGSSSGSTSSTGGASAPAVTLNVFAAASLKNAFQDIANQYHKAHSNVSFKFNFAGSQVLEQQLANGAPADVFASADLDNMNKASQAGLVSNPQVFAKNRLVIIVPSSNPAGVNSLQDLAKKGLKFDIAASTVPAGKYCRQAFDKMAQSSTYGPQFEKALLSNVISQEDNVTAVLQKVELGEADAGCVYQTDAASAQGKVKIIPIPDEFNVIAQYPIAVVKTSAHASEAQGFVDYVLGPQGQATLEKYQFIPKNG
ncbi:molybdate ABC transporter substrate-binding protein [Thermogemmatispora onikobensis]|uniref:molybdate ABC transporter substrate-binding protein n=1 Tax=Thermogemmatispora onikobensis TaxID=732234 RepID=UPI000A50793E|nr:molybdate ABC transporter substrate-binding protein [Thermogemmatispora onikobensis]